MICNKKKETVFVLTLFTLILFPAAVSVWADVSTEYLKEAKKLAAIEEDYIKARMHNDWKTIYKYQHPDFKKRFSYEEFIFFEGRVAFKAGKKAKVHLSGASGPTPEQLEEIKSDPRKKDMFDIPHPRYYKWTGSALVRITAHRLEKISISKDGNHAAASLKLKAKEQVPPLFVGRFVELDTQVDYIDFWEKIGGQWAVTLLVRPTSISGAEFRYFVPNRSDHWGQMEFVDIKPKDMEKVN